MSNDTPEGWKLVPINPTPEMMAAGIDWHTNCPNEGHDRAHNVAVIYSSMLVAAPVSPATGRSVVYEICWDDLDKLKTQELISVEKEGHIIIVGVKDDLKNDPPLRTSDFAASKI